MINLQLTGDQYIEDCMEKFFRAECIDDYKVEG